MMIVIQVIQFLFSFIHTYLHLPLANRTYVEILHIFINRNDICQNIYHLHDNKKYNALQRKYNIVSPYQALLYCNRTSPEEKLLLDWSLNNSGNVKFQNLFIFFVFFCDCNKKHFLLSSFLAVSQFICLCVCVCGLAQRRLLLESCNFYECVLLQLPVAFTPSAEWQN